MNLGDPLLTSLSSLVVAICFAGWVLPHEERWTGGGTSSCASQVACICGQHGSTRGLWAVSACRGGAGDRLCCFYWVREAPGGLFSLFPAQGINAERHPGRNSGELRGSHGGIHDGHPSCHLGERSLPMDENPSTHGSVLRSQHYTKVFWAARALVAVQHPEVLLKWSGLSLDSFSQEIPL